jgi:hypothetical protein
MILHSIATEQDKRASEGSRHISMTMRAISGIVLGLILEHLLCDKTLEAKWNELPEFLTAMILDELGSDQS